MMEKIKVKLKQRLVKIQKNKINMKRTKFPKVTKYEHLLSIGRAQAVAVVEAQGAVVVEPQVAVVVEAQVAVVAQVVVGTPVVVAIVIVAAIPEVVAIVQHLVHRAHFLRKNKKPTGRARAVIEFVKITNSDICRKKNNSNFVLLNAESSKNFRANLLNELKRNLGGPVKDQSM